MRKFRIYEVNPGCAIGGFERFFPQEWRQDANHPDGEWVSLGYLIGFETLEKARDYLDKYVNPPEPIIHPYP